MSADIFDKPPGNKHHRKTGEFMRAELLAAAKNDAIVNVAMLADGIQVGVRPVGR